jgi:hypothetical protein
MKRICLEVMDRTTFIISLFMTTTDSILNVCNKTIDKKRLSSLNLSFLYRRRMSEERKDRFQWAVISTKCLWVAWIWRETKCCKWTTSSPHQLVRVRTRMSTTFTTRTTFSSLISTPTISSTHSLNHLINLSSPTILPPSSGTSIDLLWTLWVKFLLRNSLKGVSKCSLRLYSKIYPQCLNLIQVSFKK